MATRKKTVTAAQEIQDGKAAESPAVAVAESSEGQTAEVQPSVSCALAVCAFPGTEELMTAVWSRFYDGAFKVISVSETESAQDILARLVADEGMADEFAFFLPNTVPCSKVSAEELAVPYVYVLSTGQRQFASGVPMRFAKASLVSLLAEDTEGKKDDEAFLAAYMAKFRNRPVEVGFRFGNFITPVLRGDPCENVVIEAFIRKRFLSASKPGFNAVAGLIENALLK